MPEFFATCPKGLENLLSRELAGLGAAAVGETAAGVRFGGDARLAARVCLRTRFASRVLMPIGKFSAESDEALYAGARALPWEEYFSPRETVAVSFNGLGGCINNTLYGALRIKDALCDRFAALAGSRPDVDREDPDVRIDAHLDRRGLVTVSLDLSGRALHRREYRVRAGAAPLKENLAAAIVARSGYAGGPVVDPMCGSGTLLIEAAMAAAGIAPGLFRTAFGFEKLKGFDAAYFAGLRREAAALAEEGKKRLAAAKVFFYGFDSDPEVLAAAARNAEKAGLGELVRLAPGDVREIRNPSGSSTGFVLTNPPYGERMGSFPELLGLYADLGRCLRNGFPGWRAAVISSSDDLLGSLRLRPDRIYKLYNGALECRLRVFALGAAGADGEAPAETEERDPAEDFANRLRKNLRRLEKWAAREGIEAYRIYDADLPGYNAAIDRYGPNLVIQEYAAPKTVDPAAARRRLLDLIRTAAAVTGTPGDRVVVKVRERQRGDSQYGKLGESGRTELVREYGAAFAVNLRDYLDTGLFLDHREVRRMIARMSAGKTFLNLFAYTGAATVAAALGGAASTVTVDMSRTYLAWAEENMRANGFGGARHRFVRADCLRWLDLPGEAFDLVYCDPPTFSNSKRMEVSFDVQRDHPALIARIAPRVKIGGALIFSCNRRNFVLDRERAEACGFSVRDVTAATIPEDFARDAKIHSCFVLTREREAEIPAEAAGPGFGSAAGLRVGTEFVRDPESRPARPGGRGVRGFPGAGAGAAAADEIPPGDREQPGRGPRLRRRAPAGAETGKDS